MKHIRTISILGLGVATGYGVVWATASTDTSPASYHSKSKWEDRVSGISLLRHFLLSNCQGNVLEIGAGTGRNISHYRNAKVILTDTSADMLAVLRDQLQAFQTSWTHWLFPCQFEILQANAEQLDFPDNAFDTVVSTFTLCSITHPDKALSEISRVLKPTGTLLMMEHGISCTDNHKPRYAFINHYLSTHAQEHAIKWGCEWDRNVGQLIANHFPDASFKRYHFGTTVYSVLKRTQ